MSPDTLNKGFAAISASLGDAGYPTVTVEKVAAIYKRWQRGEKAADDIDRFAFDEFAKFPAIFGKPGA